MLDQGVIQQVGSPIELYDAPVNRFVADFLGTANLLNGRVTTDDGKAVFQTDGGTTLPLTDNGVQVGENCTAMFRPQDLTIQETGKSAPEGQVKLLGKVEHREFLGNLVRYAVTVGEHQLAVDDSHSAGRKTFDAGEDVVLNLAVEQVRVLPG